MENFVWSAPQAQLSPLGGYGGRGGVGDYFPRKDWGKNYKKPMNYLPEPEAWWLDMLSKPRKS